MEIMMIKKVALVVFISVISFITGICGEHLIILHTNDTHSQIDPDFDGKGGIFRRKVLIDSIRNAEKNVLLVDAGDIVQGTLYFSLYGGNVEFPLMDSLKYDIVIPGNHEFDNGLDSVAAFYKKLKAIKLSANYDFSNTKLKGEFLPYIIKNYDGKKIGIIGIGLDPKGMISDKNYEGMKYKNAIIIADSIATFLKNKEKVDLVVAISHIGYEAEKEGLPSDVELAKSSKDIDIIIGGHSHSLIDPNGKESEDWLVKNADGRDVLICQTGRAGKYLGYVDIDLESLNSKSSVLPVTKSYDSRIDKALYESFKPYRDPVMALLSKTVAISTKEMRNGRMGALANWTSDAAKEIAQQMVPEKIDLAIMNGGGIRQSMPKGEVSEGLIVTMFPFDNTLVVMKIKGSDLLDAFKVMAFRDGDLVSNGVKVLYTKDKEIKSATINGKKIDKDKYYTLATINYLANGGDHMAPLKRGKIIATYKCRFGEAILEYVKELTKKGLKIDASDESRMYQVD